MSEDGLDELTGRRPLTSTPHNQDLGTRRAAAVKGFFAGVGIADWRIASVGFGQDRPVAFNDTSLSRAQSRRVEIVRD